MSETLRKAITKRSKLRETFNKKLSSENWRNYKWQRNICCKLPKSTKKTFFGNLNIREITDNIKFWKTLQPFFSDKCKSNNILYQQKKLKLSSITKKFPASSTSITIILKSYQMLKSCERTGKLSFENEESCNESKTLLTSIFLLKLFPRKMF